MLKDILDYLKNPFLIAAVAVSLLIYSGLLPLRPKNPYYSMLPLQSVIELSGGISSNPSRFSSGSYYSATIDLESVSSLQNSSLVKAEAGGQIKLWIPSGIVEALYPGKLFSLSGKSALIEKGERIVCRGVWKEDYQCFLVSSLEHLGHGSGFWGELEHFRALCRLIFKRLMYSWGAAGGLVLSLLSGSREYLADNVADSFRNAGLSHILALSGMHLSFFAGLSSKAGVSILGKRWSRLFQALGILFFIWFAGLSPSLFRAFLCSALAIIAKGVFCCTADTLEILSVSFLIHVCLIPDDAMTAAFMLSYGALAGILIFSKLFQRLFSVIFPPKLSSSLSASTSAQALTAPISLKLFGSFAPIGIVATVFAAPLISVFLALAIAGIIISLCMPFLSTAFGDIMNLLYDLIVWIVGLFASCPPVKA